MATTTVNLRLGVCRVRTERVARVLREHVSSQPEGIRHTASFFRRVNRGLGPISQFADSQSLRIFMKEVLGLNLSAFGKPTWILDENFLLLLVRCQRQEAS